MVWREAFCGAEEVEYAESVTGLLEKALTRLEALPPAEQDAVAAQILDTLDDDAAWEASFRDHPEHLRTLADEALREHRAGETRPLRNYWRDEVPHLPAVPRSFSRVAGECASPRTPGVQAVPTESGTPKPTVQEGG